MNGWRLQDIERLQNRGLTVVAPLIPVSHETKKPKYGNKKTVANGIEFDSKKEANRYNELRLMQHAGIISDLKTQKKFEIIINGQLICSYIADFSYKKDGVIVTEDVKGFKNSIYRLKKKLMKAVHNIQIFET